MIKSVIKAIATIVMTFCSFSVLAQEIRTDNMGSNITISDIVIAPGETASVEICLNNPIQEYRGFQFDLSLGNGVSVVSAEKTERLTNLGIFQYSKIDDFYRFIGAAV